MLVLQTKWFERWAAKEGLSGRTLRLAVREMERGLVDADLGGNVVKKRIAVGGRGKSGGVRTIVALKAHDRAFYLYGFAKNQRDNISGRELLALKKMAEHLLAYDTKKLDQAIAARELVEVTND